MTARANYKINHQRLRAIARSDAAMQGISRATALERVCRDRLYWLGDRYSQPVSDKAALAALLVLRSPGGDPLEYVERARRFVDTNCLSSFLRCRHAMRAMWTSKAAGSAA